MVERLALAASLDSSILGTLVGHLNRRHSLGRWELVIEWCRCVLGVTHDRYGHGGALRVDSVKGFIIGLVKIKVIWVEPPCMNGCMIPEQLSIANCWVCLFLAFFHCCFLFYFRVQNADIPVNMDGSDTVLARHSSVLRSSWVLSFTECNGLHSQKLPWLKKIIRFWNLTISLSSSWIPARVSPGGSQADRVYEAVDRDVTTVPGSRYPRAGHSRHRAHQPGRSDRGRKCPRTGYQHHCQGHQSLRPVQLSAEEIKVYENIVRVTGFDSYWRS